MQDARSGSKEHLTKLNCQAFAPLAEGLPEVLSFPEPLIMATTNSSPQILKVSGCEVGFVKILCPNENIQNIPPC